MDGNNFSSIFGGRGSISPRTPTRIAVAAITAKLDFSSPPHRNSDGEEIGSPLLHRYQEGFGDKWACPVSTGSFLNLGDPWLTLLNFMRFCNIMQQRLIKRGRFT